MNGAESAHEIQSAGSRSANEGAAEITPGGENLAGLLARLPHPREDEGACGAGGGERAQCLIVRLFILLPPSRDQENEFLMGTERAFPLPRRPLCAQD